MTSPARNDYIDALRGYAITGVICLHTAQHCAGLGEMALLWTEEGARGVQLFFVVSALTLTASWHARGDGAGPFYIRRLFRIAPMYWLAILVFTALHAWRQGQLPPPGIGWAEIWLNASLLHGLTPWGINSVVPGGWTIAAEATFYLILPLLLAWITSLHRALTALFLSGAAAFLLRFTATGIFMLTAPYAPQPLISSYTYSWLPAQLPVFIIGIGVFFALRDHRWRLPRLWLDVLLAALLIAVALSPLLRLDFNIRHIWFALLFGGIAYGLGNGAGAWLVNRLVAGIGSISYSAYFVHFLVLELAVAQLVPRLGIAPEAQSGGYFAAAFLLVCAATFAVSTATYRLVEQPMIRLGARLTSAQPTV